MSVTDLELTFPGSLSATSLEIDADITRDQYVEMGSLIGRVYESLRFAIGDYLKRGVELFGDDAYQLSESLGISHESKLQYVRVADAIEPERRRPELTWSHHRDVAAMEPEQQDHWLEQAVANDWTKADMHAHITGQRELTWKPDLDTLVSAARDVYEYLVNDMEVPAPASRALGAALGIIEA